MQKYIIISGAEVKPGDLLVTDTEGRSFFIRQINEISEGPVLLNDGTLTKKKVEKIKRAYGRFGKKARAGIPAGQVDQVKTKRKYSRKTSQLNNFECLECAHEFESADEFGDAQCPKCKSLKLVQK